MTPQKPSQIILTFEEALHVQVAYSTNVSTGNDKSWLTEWDCDCPAAPDVLQKSVKAEMQDIVTDTQQLGMAQKFCSEDVVSGEPAHGRDLWE